MAQVYYKISGNDIHYCNEQRDGYATIPYQQPPISNGKNLVIDYIDNKFILPTSAAGLCYGITNSNLSETYKGDTSGCYSMEAMFANCENLNYVSFSTGDTSHVTNMQTMFYKCKNLPTSTLQNLNTSSVRNMYNMFAFCSGITDASFCKNGDMRNVTTISGMFGDCYNLKTIDISNWKLDSLINCSALFTNDSKLETITALPDTDGNGLYGDGNNMFQACTKLSAGDGGTDITRANNTEPNGYFKGIMKKYDTYIKWADDGYGTTAWQRDSEGGKGVEVYKK